VATNGTAGRNTLRHAHIVSHTNGEQKRTRNEQEKTKRKIK